MKKILFIFMAFVLVIAVTACGNKNQTDKMDSAVPEGSQQTENEQAGEQEKSIRVASDGAQTQTDDSGNKAETEDRNKKMNVEIGSKFFTATLEDNVATRELVKRMEKGPIPIDMDDYSGFEKVGSLGKSLPTDNQQMTTQAGDIVLYNGNQIVLFYGSNSWDYTKIGRIDDLSGWEDALGTDSITAVFSIVK